MRTLAFFVFINRSKLYLSLSNSLLPSLPFFSFLIFAFLFAGLIDELFGISQGSTRLPGEKFGGQEAETDQEKVVQLSSTEQLYAEIRLLLAV